MPSQNLSNHETGPTSRVPLREHDRRSNNNDAMNAIPVTL